MASRFKVTDYLHFKYWLLTDIYAEEGNNVAPSEILSDETYIKKKTIQSKLMRSMFEKPQD